MAHPNSHPHSRGWPVQALLGRGLSAASVSSLSEKPFCGSNLKFKSPASQAGLEQLPVGTLLAKHNHHSTARRPTIYGFRNAGFRAKIKSPGSHPGLVTLPVGTPPAKHDYYSTRRNSTGRYKGSRAVRRTTDSNLRRSRGV